MVLAQTPLTAFQSPRSGKFVSDAIQIYRNKYVRWFQSPRSGKFVSDKPKCRNLGFCLYGRCFNPLDRGNLYQICPQKNIWNQKSLEKGFNPLDRGNLYQIKIYKEHSMENAGLFQSPRSGKFVSDIRIKIDIP